MARRRKRTSTAPKTRTITRTRTVGAASPIIRVQAPARMQRLRKHAKRARGAAISAGKTFLGVAQNQLVAVGSAAGLAFLQKQGVAIPKVINSLSVPANAGLLAWGAARLLKSPMLDHVATGLLCVGAYGFAGGNPIQGDVMGDGNGRAVVFGDDLDGDETEGDDD